MYLEVQRRLKRCPHLSELPLRERPIFQYSRVQKLQSQLIQLWRLL